MSKKTAPRKLKDVQPKKGATKGAAKVKGGGPGTQTEDDVYVGRRLR